MTNMEKYIQAFSEAFEDTADAVKQYEFKVTPAWDSIGHMTLIAALEDTFDFELEPAEIRGITSFEKGIEVLRRKGVDF